MIGEISKMLANYDREKLINAILFFCGHTKYCGITKLFKLLYFLDFEHYKQIGRSVTGLDYYAWKMGPVPTRLYNEIPNALEPDLAERVQFIAIRSKHKNHFVKIQPKQAFVPKMFSKREIRIMTELAKEYKNSLADDMIEATHLENLPWHQVYCVEGNQQGIISYEYALKKADADLIGYIVKENKEVISNYS